MHQFRHFFVSLLRTHIDLLCQLLSKALQLDQNFIFWLVYSVLFSLLLVFWCLKVKKVKSTHILAFHKSHFVSYSVKIFDSYNCAPMKSSIVKWQDSFSFQVKFNENFPHLHSTNFKYCPIYYSNNKTILRSSWLRTDSKKCLLNQNKAKRNGIEWK